MEYEKIINLLDNTPNQPSKFRKKMYWNKWWCKTKTKFAITNTKLYVPIVILSIQDNAKLLEQLKSGFKRTINWKLYLD